MKEINNRLLNAANGLISGADFLTDRSEKHVAKAWQRLARGQGVRANYHIEAAGVLNAGARTLIRGASGLTNKVEKNLDGRNSS